MDGYMKEEKLTLFSGPVPRKGKVIELEVIADRISIFDAIEEMNRYCDEYCIDHKGVATNKGQMAAYGLKSHMVQWLVKNEK